MLTIDLSGRRALVTGGARGIGAGIVRSLALSGAGVAFTHLGTAKDQAAADQLVAELAGEGRLVVGLVAPAQDIEAMSQAASEAAQRLGGLDIVVPNVGQNWVATVDELDLEGWRRGVDINLTSAFIAVKVALPWMKQAGRADIVFIGSSAVVDGGGGVAHYAAAKAGLEGFMKALMRELPVQGFRINTVNPCVVDTDLLRERYDTEEKRAQLAAQVPVGRIARPEDIGSLVAFICSDLGSFICGQSILVDGGRSIWRGTAKR
jgi:3-oxoacyl-[acyl-carrier protein] reductase